jgi:hypothetical protein
MSDRPHVPDCIRRFSYPGWINVFQLVPTNDHLYATETLFGDWDSRVLLLAKDACPTRAIQGSSDRRHAQRELGDKQGWKTNDRLRLPLLPEKEFLYGSAAANMLCDDPRWSRSLPGFFAGDLHEFLKCVLSWVVDSMPRLEWVACLGTEAWFLTCVAIGDSASATRFKECRDSYKPVIGVVGRKRIRAFPLYHPAARVKIHLMESGWLAFAAHLS